MEAIHNHTPKFFWNGLRSLTFGCLILFTCWLYCIRNFKVQWGGNATNYEDCGNKFFEWFHLQIMTVRFEKCMTRKRRNQPWNLLGLLYRLCMNCFHCCVISLQSTNCFFFPLNLRVMWSRLRPVLIWWKPILKWVLFG